LERDEAEQAASRGEHAKASDLFEKACEFSRAAKSALDKFLPRASSATSTAPFGSAARINSASRTLSSATGNCRRSSISRMASGQRIRSA